MKKASSLFVFLIILNCLFAGKSLLVGCSSACLLKGCPYSVFVHLKKQRPFSPSTYQVNIQYDSEFFQCELSIDENEEVKKHTCNHPTLFIDKRIHEDTTSPLGRFWKFYGLIVRIRRKTPSTFHATITKNSKEWFRYEVSLNYRVEHPNGHRCNPKCIVSEARMVNLPTD